MFIYLNQHECFSVKVYSFPSQGPIQVSELLTTGGFTLAFKNLRSVST